MYLYKYIYIAVNCLVIPLVYYFPGIRIYMYTGTSRHVCVVTSSCLMKKFGNVRFKFTRFSELLMSIAV